jgi:hypothetical protein
VVTGPPKPSAAFRAWVDNVKISGARGGAAARVFIGKTAYGAGDIVDSTLGIMFDGYDTESRTLVFKDKSGATVERRL